MMEIQTLTKDVQEAKLMDAEISKTKAETDKVKAETKKLDIDVDARVAEIRKMNADAALVHTRRDWYPLAAGSAATLAIIGVIKLFM